MKNEKYLVYKHTTPNGKVYIGQTKVGANGRWKNGKGYTTNKVGFFYKAIEKYGWENIEHVILADGLSKEEADEIEKELIARYNATDRRYGYNCTSGGSSGYKYTKAAKGKISDGLKKHYKEYGKPDSAKARDALQEKQGRRIVQYDLFGNRIGEYKSALEASGITGISNHRINQCLIGRQKQTGGFMWRYKEDAPERIEPYKIKRPCVQYSLDGVRLKEWPDVKEADSYFGKDQKRCTIEHCCDGTGFNTAYGYIWRFAEDAPDQLRPAAVLGREIIQFTTNGEQIKKYANASEAERVTNIKAKTIQACARGTNKTAGGYVWKYAG